MEKQGQCGQVLLPALAMAGVIAITGMLCINLLQRLRADILLQSRTDCLALSAGMLYSRSLKCIQGLNHALYAAAVLEAAAAVPAVNAVQKVQDAFALAAPAGILARCRRLALRNGMNIRMKWNGKGAWPDLGLRRRGVITETLRHAAGNRVGDISDKASFFGLLARPGIKEQWFIHDRSSNVIRSFERGQVQPYIDRLGRKGWRLARGMDQGQKFVAYRKYAGLKKIKDIQLDMVTSVKTHRVDLQGWFLDRKRTFLSIHSGMTTNKKAGCAIEGATVSALKMSYDFKMRLDK